MRLNKGACQRRDCAVRQRKACAFRHVISCVEGWGCGQLCVCVCRTLSLNHSPAAPCNAPLYTGFFLPSTWELTRSRAANSGRSLCALVPRVLDVTSGWPEIQKQEHADSEFDTRWGRGGRGASHLARVPIQIAGRFFAWGLTASDMAAAQRTAIQAAFPSFSAISICCVLVSISPCW